MENEVFRDIKNDFRESSYYYNQLDKTLSLVLGKCRCCGGHFGMKYNFKRRSLSFGCLLLNQDNDYKQHCEIKKKNRGLCFVNECPLKDEVYPLVRTKNTNIFSFLGVILAKLRGDIKLTLRNNSAGETFQFINNFIYTLRLFDATLVIEIYTFDDKGFIHLYKKGFFNSIRYYFNFLVMRFRRFMSKILNIDKLDRISSVLLRVFRGYGFSIFYSDTFYQTDRNDRDFSIQKWLYQC